MDIMNVGASEKYVYTPYYTIADTRYMTIQDEDNIKSASSSGMYTLKYFPYNKQITDTSNYLDINFNEAAYYGFVKNAYTQVPDKNKKVLKKLCEEQGFSSLEPNIVEHIQNYFRQSYVYSLRCGTTPDNEDFVNYFIENKKGFCAHFASTGALILRYLGIPARYVEGYVITKDMVKDADEYGEREDFIIDDGNNNTSNPIKVAVKDNKAHAWIEVYKEGFGWVPYEMTYYSRQEDMNSSVDKEDKKEVSVIDTFLVDINKKMGTLVNGIKLYGLKVVTIIMVTLCVLILTAFVRVLVIKIRRKKEFNSSEYRDNIVSITKYFFKVCSFLGVKKEQGMTIDEYLSILHKERLVTTEMLNISEEEYRHFKEYVENVVEIQYNDLSLKDKFLFKIVYNL